MVVLFKMYRDNISTTNKIKSGAKGHPWQTERCTENPEVVLGYSITLLVTIEVENWVKNQDLPMF